MYKHTITNKKIVPKNEGKPELTLKQNPSLSARKRLKDDLVEEVEWDGYCTVVGEERAYVREYSVEKDG